MNTLRLGTLFWLVLSVSAAAKTWTVNPGQSIQAAIDKAGPGDTVQAIPGEYPESIRIDKENLRVVGMTYEGQRTELLGEDFRDVGIIVAADGVRVEGFILRGFMEVGVQAKGVSDISLRGLNINACGRIGIELDRVIRGAIENCVSGGARRFNVRAYRSQEIRVADGEFFRSGTGIWFYDTVKSTVENNAIYENGRGIVISGAGLPEHPTAYCKVLFNRIFQNDVGPIEEPDLHDAEWLPFGIAERNFGYGIVISKADHTEISRNVIEGNTGIGVFVGGAPDEDENPKLASPNTSDHTYVHHNTYIENGTGKSDSDHEKVSPPRCDIYWDGTGERNQFQESQDVKTFPEKLIVEQGGVHTEVIHFL